MFVQLFNNNNLTENRNGVKGRDQKKKQVKLSMILQIWTNKEMSWEWHENSSFPSPNYKK